VSESSHTPLITLTNVTLVFLGTDFQDSSFRSLEALEAIAPAIREHVHNQRDLVEGSMVVATCNRFEVYLDTPSSPEALANVVGAIAVHLGQSELDTRRMFRVLHDGGAVAHLLRVAAGLESMVIGEGEIMAQLREAMSWAQDLGSLSTPLLRATERAFRVSKTVANTYGLSHTGRSLIDAALDSAGEVVGSGVDPRVVVIGTGAYARVVLAALARRGITDVRVYSRSGRAEQFASQHGVGHILPGGLIEAFRTSDLVISASGQPGYAMSLAELASHAPPQTPVVCIDVALSRDVDPLLERAGYARIISLESIRPLLPRDHSHNIIAAEKHLENEATRFVREDQSRGADPVVASLRAHVRALIDEEVASVERRHGSDVALAVQHSLHRVTNHLLHAPSVRAKSLSEEGFEDEFRRAVDVLFGSEVTEGV
jgi:glutamyl-tRNA reductase